MSTNDITNTPPIKARAPGKLILSGEHSVVYGAPAIALAIECYTDVWFTPMHRIGGVRTAFENLSQGQLYPLDLLKSFKQKLDNRFEQFTRGELSVQNILQRPDDLAVYSLASLLHFLPVPGVTETHRLPVPGQLSSRSELPLGAGMGSSASVVAATFILYEHLLNRPQNRDERFERVRFAERLQHGKGSSIDAASVVYGGVNHVINGVASQPDLAEDHPLKTGEGWYWVLHGIPAASTGECVAEVQKKHGEDRALWSAFEEVTNALMHALENGDDPREIIKQNHALLVKIGVVPSAAQRFVQAVENAGGAAKISGAGSVRGDHGGVILVNMPDHQAMETLMQNYPDRRWQRLRLDQSGARLMTNGAAS